MLNEFIYNPDLSIASSAFQSSHGLNSKVQNIDPSIKRPDKLWDDAFRNENIWLQNLSIIVNSPNEKRTLAADKFFVREQFYNESKLDDDDDHVNGAHTHRDYF